MFNVNLQIYYCLNSISLHYEYNNPKESHMKQDLIKELFEKFEAACYEINGVECWSARELQLLLGYSKWENFEKVIGKAREACENAGENQRVA